MSYEERYEAYKQASYLSQIEFGELPDICKEYLKEYLLGNFPLKVVKSSCIRYMLSKMKRCAPEQQGLWDNKYRLVRLDDLRYVLSFLTTVKIMELDEKTFPFFDYRCYKEIHEELFGEAFDWAGVERNIDLEKKMAILNGRKLSFLEFNEIQKDVKLALDMYERLAWNTKIDDEIKKTLKKMNIFTKWEDEDYLSKSNTLADATGRLWYIHPFYEGNMTATLYYTIRFAAANNVIIDRKTLLKLHKKDDLRKSLLLASVEDDELKDITFLASVFNLAMTNGKKQISAKNTEKEERRSLADLIKQAAEELESEEGSDTEDDNQETNTNEDDE